MFYGSSVVKTTVLLADMKDFNVMNDVYKSFFTKNFPARAAFQVFFLLQHIWIFVFI